MRAVKSCLVCGKYHLARQRCTRNDVTAVIEKVKAKHSTALLKVEKLSSNHSTVHEKGREEADKEADLVQWAEESQSQDNDFIYFEIGEGTEIEQVFSPNAFLHGPNLQSNDNWPHHEDRSDIFMQ